MSLGWRALVVSFAVPSLVLAMVTPPEHVHAADLDRPNAVVHRHVELHHHEEPAPASDGDHDDGAVDHEHHHDFDWTDDGGPSLSDDEDVVWLDSVGLLQTAQPVEQAPAVLADTADIGLVSDGRWMPPPSYDSAPPHGPPRRLRTPRAPPSPSV